MKPSSASEDRGYRTSRTARVVVADPDIVVVEGPDVADPSVLDGALELFVKWAVRAHKSSNPAAPEAPTDENSATYATEK